MVESEGLVESGARSLAQGFAGVDDAYGPVPIWWWSGAPLRRDRLRWQMEQMRDQGVRNAVIMCLAPRGPLFGAVADDPPFLSEAWWQVFLDACADAREIGFRFWLYDQLGFSGANFQGQVVTAAPEYAGWELRRAVAHGDGGEVTVAVPAGGTAVAAYAVRPDSSIVPVEVRDGGATYAGGPARLCLAYTVRRGFDYHHPGACATLIDTVLGEFERRARQFFGSVIVGLFQDELPTMPSWSGTFAASFAQAHGYDLGAEIAHLWEDAGARGDTVRRDYHRHRARLASAAFFVPLADWAARWGLTAGFDQQSPAREGDPTGGVALYGDYLATHARFTAPGSDHWGDPKVHSSLAHAGGQPRTWLEAFHSSGWGGTLEETYDWLGPFLRRGATLYDPHAVYYATTGGWWEWAPPSTCWRQPYWPAYRVFAESVTRLCRLLSTGSLVCDTVLLHPTLTVQAGLTLEGALPDARRASGVYHELNGATSWFSEQPGVLDAAGHDYEVFDEATLAAGTLAGGALHLAGGAFRNVVLPDVRVLDAPTAALLVDFAAAGGTVLCVGRPPSAVLDDPTGEHAAALADAVRDGRIAVVPAAAMVPERLVRGPVHVRADAPVLLRRHGDALVLLFVAHDERSGTRAPILPDHRNLNWVEETFRWDRYWTALAERGYTFVPPGDRRIAARVSGAPGRRAQRWDPRTGERTELPVRAEGDQVYLDLGFDDGSMAVVVLADDLPPATRTDPGPVAEAVEAGPGWQIEALSTADNSWGDLAGAARSGVLPVQVWQFAHRPDDDDAPWQPVHAGFGPYVQVRPEQAEPAPGERGGWQPGEYSLSHGIRKDPLHFEYLGPKAMVPEEFLAWPDATPGRWVAFRTALDLPAGSGRRLSVGANADRRVYFDGAPAAAEGTGYWTLSPVPDGAGRLDVEVWLRAEGPHNPASPGPTTGIRACFAVVADERRYRRPEWLVPTDGTRAGSTVEMSHRWTLAAVPARAVLQVAAEGACTVLVNGEEVGRQGDFDPYAALRTVRVQPYDLTGALRAGENVLAVRLPDGGRQVAVLTDGLLDGDAALGTDLSWTATRDGAPVPLRLRREQWTDPRWVCLRARPHPLPRAAWLDPAAAADGVVLDLVPDASREAETAGVQWLRFAAPAGLVAFGVATTLAFTAVVAGVEYAPVDGRVRLPEPVPGGTEVLLRVLARGGRRGGSLLDGPVEAVLAPVPAELATWAEWGLRSLAGAVTYRQRVTLPAGAGEGRWTVDLGEVRGTAEVSVNGRPAGVLAFGPYRLDVSGLLRPGGNDVEVVVRGTLAGYLDDVSPTPAIAAGQTRTGLLGPVRFVRHAEPAAGDGGPGAG